MVDDWDPKPVERVYYRDVTTGDLGWMVRRDGRDCIRLDRPMDNIERHFNPLQWVVDREPVPLTVGQVAEIAFEAWKTLCRSTGRYVDAKLQWRDLDQEERRLFIDAGPASMDKQQDQAGKYAQLDLRLYVAVKTALGKYSR